GLGSSDGLFAETELGSALEAHIVMNDFRPLDQTLKDWPRFRPCKVDREAPLRPRRRLIITMHEPDAVARQRLDLDDVGAHVAHHGRPHRAGEKHAKIKNANAFKDLRWGLRRRRHRLCRPSLVTAFAEAGSRTALRQIGIAVEGRVRLARPAELGVVDLDDIAVRLDIL